MTDESLARAAAEIIAIARRNEAVIAVMTIRIAKLTTGVKT